jgi:hypothetical protein
MQKRPWAVVFVLLVSMVASASAADSNKIRSALHRQAAADASLKRRLADSLIENHARASGRVFSPMLRSSLRQRLLALPLEKLNEAEAAGTHLAVTNAIPAGTSPTVFVPVTPCRVVDTRSSAGGILVAGTAQPFLVAGDTGFAAQGGNASGCGVPLGAVAAAVNFGATQSAGAGNVRAYAWANPAPTPPLAATINYGNLAPNLVTMPNGAIVPLCDPALATCTFDVFLLASVSPTHLVADVTGYFVKSADAMPMGDESLDSVTLTGFDTLVASSSFVPVFDGRCVLTCSIDIEQDVDSYGFFSAALQDVTAAQTYSYAGWGNDITYPSGKTSASHTVTFDVTGGHEYKAACEVDSDGTTASADVYPIFTWFCR